MRKHTKHFYEFGLHRIDTEERVLLCNGENIPLTPKVFDTLLLLVENRGHILTKDELLTALWPESFVEEGSLSQNIFLLRRSLGEGSNGLKYIETIPKRGYRFIPTVTELWEDKIDPPAEEPPQAIIPAITEVTAQVTTKEESLPAPLPVLPSRRWSRRALLFLAAGLVGSLLLIFLALRLEQPATVAAVKSIAVLPFKPLNPQSDDSYIGLGMTETLINRITNIKKITVRPTSAVLKYSNAGQDPLIAGRELGVDSVLDGSIQKVGDRIRVTVHLLRVSDGSALWTNSFDENFTNIFTVQDLISEKVVSALLLKISSDEKERLKRRYTDNVEAYNLYLKGRYFWNKHSTKDIEKSIEFFQQALEKDGAYALAYAGMADAYTLLGYRYNSPVQKEAMAQAKKAALQALEIDDSLPEAHASLGFVLFRHDWDWLNAEKELRRAIDLDPNYATAHHFYGRYMLASGRLDDALREIRLAQQLDPISLRINVAMAESLYFARLYDKSQEQLQKILEMDPNYEVAQRLLGTVYEQQGLYDKGIEESLKGRILAGQKPETIELLKQAYKRAGMKGYWQEALKAAGSRVEKGTISPYSIAVLYENLGDTDKAFEWLEKSYEDRSLWLAYLRYDPKLDRLRSDPRYSDLLRRIGLGEIRR